MNLFEKLFKRTKSAPQANMPNSSSHGNMLELAAGNESNSSSRDKMINSASHGSLSKLFSQLKKSHGKPQETKKVKKETPIKIAKFIQAETLFLSSLKINAEDEKSIKDEKLKINEELNIQTSKIIAASKSRGDIIKIIKDEIGQWEKTRQENIILDSVKQSELNELKAERIRNCEPVIEDQTEHQALFVSWSKNFKEVEYNFFRASLDVLINAKNLNLKKSKVREKLVNLNEITKLNSIETNLKKKKSVSFSQSITSSNSAESLTNLTGILFQATAAGKNIENSNASWTSQSTISNMMGSKFNLQYDPEMLNKTWDPNETWDPNQELRFE